MNYLINGAMPSFHDDTTDLVISCGWCWLCRVPCPILGIRLLRAAYSTALLSAPQVMIRTDVGLPSLSYDDVSGDVRPKCLVIVILLRRWIGLAEILMLSMIEHV
jgi:hypothetical protein